MLKLKLLLGLTLVSIIVVLSGCATTDYHYTGRKNHLVKDIKPGVECDICDIRPDWYRIANMTDEEICKAINCPEKEKIVIKEVPGPERIVTKEVIKEVPVERIVTKEVPVEKIVEKKPFFTLPGAFFDTDKADLKPAGKVELDKAARTLKENGYPAIIISGHTDSRASDDYNMKLSERRADSVMKFLESKGVPASTMTAKGYGKTKPIASNSTKEGMAQNRRVELTLAN